MPSFISGCACRGNRPKSMSVRNIQKREDLISRLMQERDVLRLICAPDGYGKSVLAMQYAEIVFGFQGVYWVNCQSPCFMRDLDSGEFLEMLLSDSRIPNLVVFDNVLYMEGERAEKISNVIEGLLNNRCEVVATVRPLNRGFVIGQKDCMVLNSRDMLISDVELEVFGSEQYRTMATNSILRNIYRIPQLFWGGPKAAQELVRSTISSELTTKIIFGIFVIYLLGKGSLDILKSLFKKSDYELILDIAKEYLHLGIDVHSHVFCVPKLSVSELLKSFLGFIDDLIQEYGNNSRNTFGLKMARIALKNDDVSRFLETVRSICTKDERRTILEAFSFDAFEDASLYEATKMYESLKLNQSSKNAMLRVENAWRLFFLSDEREAKNVAYQVLETKNASNEAGVLSAAIFLVCGSLTEKNQALRIMNIIKRDVPLIYPHEQFLFPSLTNREISARITANTQSMMLISYLCLEILDILENDGDVFRWWLDIFHMDEKSKEEKEVEKAESEKVATEKVEAVKEGKFKAEKKLPDFSDSTNLAVLSVPEMEVDNVLREYCTEKDKYQFLDYKILVGTMILALSNDVSLSRADAKNTYNFAKEILKHLKEKMSANAKFCLVDYLCVSELNKKNGLFDIKTKKVILKISKETSSKFSGFKSKIALERVRYADQVKKTKQGDGEDDLDKTEDENFWVGGPESLTFKHLKMAGNVSDVASHEVPVLTINVFGGLMVYADNKKIDPKCLSRQKVKALLTILVVLNGEEVNKDLLSMWLWPDSSFENAKHNLNSCWSALRSLLKLSDGSCPYISRQQNSYKLNMDLVKSDVQDMDKMCSRFTLGKIDPVSWNTMIEEGRSVLNGDLLPSENENAFIIRKRSEFKTKIVDALIAASDRLFNEEKYYESLWFAQSAIDRDNVREDAYAAAMRAQLMMGKRSAALETYFACKKFLDNQLGIAPSRSLEDLHLHAVNDDYDTEVFAG